MIHFDLLPGYIQRYFHFQRCLARVLLFVKVWLIFEEYKFKVIRYHNVNLLAGIGGAHFVADSARLIFRSSISTIAGVKKGANILATFWRFWQSLQLSQKPFVRLIFR